VTLRALSRAADAWIGRQKQIDPAAVAEAAELRPAVVVTGGSRGIGLALAREFAGANANIVLVARGTGPLEQAAAQLRTTTQATVSALALDVTTPKAPDELEKWLNGQRLYLDVLVNCAGTGLSGAFDSHDEAAIEDLLALNMTALTRLMRHALPAMRARGRGGILNVASLGGMVPGPFQAAYYASKAYVISLTEAVASENAGRGVRICALAPGPVDTGFHEAMNAQASFYRQLLPVLSPERTARAGYRGYRLGQRVIVPGLLNMLMALSLKLLPHGITVPLTAWLLTPRRTS
jgi:short-subunit dehydrogenase